MLITIHFKHFLAYQLLLHHSANASEPKDPEWKLREGSGKLISSTAHGIPDLEPASLCFFWSATHKPKWRSSAALNRALQHTAKLSANPALPKGFWQRISPSVWCLSLVFLFYVGFFFPQKFHSHTKSRSRRRGNKLETHVCVCAPFL